MKYLNLIIIKIKQIPILIHQFIKIKVKKIKLLPEKMIINQIFRILIMLKKIKMKLITQDKQYFLKAKILTINKFKSIK